MKTLFALALFLALAATVFAQPDARDSIILESKTVQPGAAPAYMTVKVWITNKDSLVFLTLPLVERSTSGGAFATLARPRTFFGVINPLTPGLRFGSAANYSKYNSSSPDSFLVGAGFDPADPSTITPPNSTRLAVWEIKFDTVQNNFGTFELDSCTFFGLGPTFTNAGPTDMPVNFVKGVIRVAAAGPPCLDAICGLAGGNIPFGQNYSFDFDCDQPGFWSLEAGPGTLDSNTGLYSFSATCSLGTSAVAIAFEDTLGGVSGCHFTLNVVDPSYIATPAQETVAASHGTLATNQITATDPDPGDGTAFTKTLGPGTVNSSGVWSYPTSCGDVSAVPYIIRIRVDDGIASCPTGLLVDTTEFKLLVTNAPPAITNFPDSVVYLDTNVAFSLQLVAGDPDPADTIFTFSLLVGPSGLTVSSAGLVEWTPTPVHLGLNEAFLRVRDGCNVNHDYRLVLAVSTTVARGDLNADGQFSPTDVVMLLNCVFQGIPPYTGAGSCDMNCDGQDAPADVVLLLKRAFNGDPLPC